MFQYPSEYIHIILDSFYALLNLKDWFVLNQQLVLQPREAYESILVDL